MYKFPADLYTDVRIEDVFQTEIRVTLGEIDEMRERRYKAAFIRIFDGKRWYYSSITNVDKIQEEIEKLSKFASLKPHCDDPTVKKFQINKGEFLEFSGDDISKIPMGEKYGAISDYFPIISENALVKIWEAYYADSKVIKNFYSSKGSDLTFDSQRVGLMIGWNLVDGDKKFSDTFGKGANLFRDLAGLEEEIGKSFARSIDFLKNSVDVKPGKYTVVLSPRAAGVFAHESFGHKSEADFMIGDETMKREWQIGKKVGSDILSIVDDGNIKGTGYVPFDDEGTGAEETYLIKNGILSGRLHSAVTATDLDEDLTGNARAKDFEFEPIVRMTTTYIKSGKKTFDELISDIDEGILVETIKHGSGMSTFTIAPLIAYKIEKGKITEPAKISVVSGDVFRTLGEIEGLSNKLEICSFAIGGCGKMEQHPLPVGFGGPYVRVKELDVQ